MTEKLFFLCINLIISIGCIEIERERGERGKEEDITMMLPYPPDNQTNSQYEYGHQVYLVTLAILPLPNDNNLSLIQAYVYIYMHMFGCWKTNNIFTYTISILLIRYTKLTLKDASWRSRAAASPEIPPPTIMTVGSELFSLSNFEAKEPTHKINTSQQTFSTCKLKRMYSNKNRKGRESQFCIFIQSHIFLSKFADNKNLWWQSKIYAALTLKMFCPRVWV